MTRKTDRSGDRSILMHIGQGKTGSSFLQSCLALSIDRLADAGIAYPIPDADRIRGEKGHVSVGNFKPRSREDGHAIEDLAAIMAGVDWMRFKSLLLSNEGIFLSLAFPDFLPALLEMTHGCRLKFLLFIRDPLEHAFSAYQQNVKSNRNITLHDHLTAQYAAPLQVRATILRLREHGLDLTIINYSRHKAALVERFEAWIGLPSGTLARAPHDRVNRSLTRTEMELQRAFARHAGPRARLMVADFLSNELPDIEPEKPYVDRETMAIFLDRMRDQVAQVSDLLPEGQGYQIPDLDTAMAGFPSEDQASRFSLSAEQIDALARGVARWLRKD